MIWRWGFFHSFRSYVLSTTITRYSYKHDWQYLWPARIYSAAGGVTTAPKFYFTHWYSSQLVDYMDGKIWLTYASSSILEYHLPLSAIFSFKNWDCFTQPPLKSWAHPHILMICMLSNAKNIVEEIAAGWFQLQRSGLCVFFILR